MNQTNEKMVSSCSSLRQAQRLQRTQPMFLDSQERIPLYQEAAAAGVCVELIPDFLPFRNRTSPIK